MNKKRKGLCFRCEYRARFFETGHGPRAECQMTDMAVFSCYMYRPVAPAITEVAHADDPRPRLGPPIISSRERYAGIAKGKYTAKGLDGGKIIVYWTPN